MPRSHDFSSRDSYAVSIFFHEDSLSLSEFIFTTKVTKIKMFPAYLISANIRTVFFLSNCKSIQDKIASTKHSDKDMHCKQKMVHVACIKCLDNSCSKNVFIFERELV